MPFTSGRAGELAARRTRGRCGSSSLARRPGPSLLAEESPPLGRHLERLPRSALRRELEDPRPVGIEPELGERRAIEPLGAWTSASGRRSAPATTDRRASMPSGAWVAKKRPLLLPEQLPQRPGAPPPPPARRPARPPFIEPAADALPASRRPPRRSPPTVAGSAGSSDGTTGRSFTTESSPFLCDPASAGDDALPARGPGQGCRGTTPGGSARRRGSSPSAFDGRAPIGARGRSASLDAVGALDQLEELLQLLVAER